jgi:rubrerythrin
MKQNDPKNLAAFINCLSHLEEDTSLLYGSIAEKIDLPLVKAFFEEIAVDSHKHSLVFKGVSETIANVKDNEKECEKNIGPTYQVLSQLQKEVVKMKRINSENIVQLSDKLIRFESSMGEEYYIFTQLKTLNAMMKEITQLYNIDLGKVKKIFLSIIQDEEHHVELLQTVHQMIIKKEESSNENYPMVKFQNPDSWIGPKPEIN